MIRTMEINMESVETHFPQWLMPRRKEKYPVRLLVGIVCNLGLLYMITNGLRIDSAAMGGASSRIMLIMIVAILAASYVLVRMTISRRHVSVENNNICVIARGRTVYKNTVDNIDHILRKRRGGYPPVYTVVFSDGNGVHWDVGVGLADPYVDTLCVQGQCVPIIEKNKLSARTHVYLGLLSGFYLLCTGLFFAFAFFLWPGVYERLALVFQGRSVWMALAIEAFVLNAVFFLQAFSCRQYVLDVKRRYGGEPHLVTGEPRMRWFR